MTSDRVVEAMARAVDAAKEKAREWNACDPATNISPDAVRQIVESACDPALGEDRLVRLGDVVEAFREEARCTEELDPLRANPRVREFRRAADFLLVRFGSEGLSASPTASETGAEGQA